MLTQSFQASQSVVLDSTGAGQVTISPRGFFDWVVTVSSVNVTTATKVPTANVYKNFVGISNFIEGSYTGNNDASNTRIVLRPSESAICVWAGGDAGATATYRVSGVQYPPNQAPLE